MSRNPSPEPRLRMMSIQRFSLHDGPGIRTTVFLQGCPLRCPWCSNPESQPLHAVPRHRSDKCAGCFSCVVACPEGLIRSGEKGLPVFNRSSCTGCGACEKICPGEAISVSGKMMEVGEIMSIVAKDADYYRNSGGGVTFSGGEALLQIEGLKALLEASRALSIPTAIETCGQVPWEYIERAEPLTDLFLYDLKHTDSDKLKRVTGGDAGLILDNLHRLSGSRKVILRVPCIPGFNLDEACLRDIFDVALREGIEEVHLLPYHTLGMDKYAQIGRQYEGERKSLPKEALEEYAEKGLQEGLIVRIGG